MWSTRNRYFTSRGREQAKKRAELLAAIAATRVHAGNHAIRSDSEYVVRVAAALLHGQRQQTAKSKENPYAEFAVELSLKTTHRLHHVWGKGDATKIHVDRESPQPWTKGRMTDASASAAAAHHAAPQALQKGESGRLSLLRSLPQNWSLNNVRLCVQ